MAVNLTKDTICLNETVLNTSSECSVELDYLLPDYYPDIFKLLKTRIIPKVQSRKISGNKLYLDGISLVRVLYLTENSTEIHCIEQTIPFSKSIELPNECENATIMVTPKCYFVNSRAVNQRRLDVRGGISCKIKVTCPKELSLVKGGEGHGMQFHFRPVTVCDRRKYAFKQFTINEELSLGHTKKGINSILNYHTAVAPTDYKIIANKIICKGDLIIHILYTSGEENPVPETMDFSVPLSQIVDIPGIDENYSTDISFDVISATFNPKSEDGDENLSLNCEFVINVSCTADENKEILITDDVYSTVFELNTTVSDLNAEQHQCSMNKEYVIKHNIETDSDNQIMGVYDAFANITDCSVKNENDTLAVNGTVELCAVCFKNDNTPFVLEKNLPFEVPIEIKDCKDINFTPECEVLNASYNIASAGSLEIRTKLHIGGNVYKKVSCNVITDVSANEEMRKEITPYALHLYYAGKGESLWNIAKRFNTSMAAVMDENSLDTEILPEDIMLLIPVVNG